jgi:hypothetical protein
MNSTIYFIGYQGPDGTMDDSKTGHVSKCGNCGHVLRQYTQAECEKLTRDDTMRIMREDNQAWIEHLKTCDWFYSNPTEDRNAEIEQQRKNLNPPSAKLLKELQEVLDSILAIPQYKHYVKERKLHLINSKFSTIDRLLEKGILKGA